MNFTPHTQDQLKAMNIKDNQEYLIEYVNKDYFNGEENIEREKAKAIINDGEIVFIVPDPFGMEKFIQKVKVIESV